MAVTQCEEHETSVTESHQPSTRGSSATTARWPRSLVGRLSPSPWSAAPCPWSKEGVLVAEVGRWRRLLEGQPRRSSDNTGLNFSAFTEPARGAPSAPLRVKPVASPSHLCGHRPVS